MSKAGESKIHVSTDIETKAIALQKLDIDVQLTILDALSQTSPKSLLNVALSSRSLYHLSKSFIYRVLHFKFNPSRRIVNGRLIKQLLTDDDLSTKVQEIRILWAPSREIQPGGGSREDIDSLERALPRLTRLKMFIWDAQYPAVSGLLETLQKHHPQCVLFTRGPAMTLPQLCASLCRLSIDVTLTSGQDQASNTAPVIRDLTVNTASLFLAQLPGSYIPLHLRSLVLYQDSGLFELPVIWSMLQKVSIADSFLDQQVVPEFSCLKSLRLRALYGEFQLLSNSLQKCKQLEVLDLIGCTGKMQTVEDSVWESVGQTLIALRLHEAVQEWAFTNRPLLSLNDMGRIVKGCRKLRSLGLDLACNGREWPYEMLQYIADEFWFIVHLELDIEIENPQHDHPTSPKATLDSVPEIWRYLWQEITNSRVRRGHTTTKPRLKSLDLKAGSKPPVTEPGLNNQQRFTFDLSIRDDEAALGIAPVKCTELEALLSNFSTVEPLWTHQQDLIMKTANERARKGPHIEMPSVTESEMLRPSTSWDRHDSDRFYHPPPP